MLDNACLTDIELVERASSYSSMLKSEAKRPLLLLLVFPSRSRPATAVDLPPLECDTDDKDDDEEEEGNTTYSDAISINKSGSIAAENSNMSTAPSGAVGIVIFPPPPPLCLLKESLLLLLLASESSNPSPAPVEAAAAEEVVAFDVSFSYSTSPKSRLIDCSYNSSASTSACKDSMRSFGPAFLFLATTFASKTATLGGLSPAPSATTRNNSNCCSASSTLFSARRQRMSPAIASAQTSSAAAASLKADWAPDESPQASRCRPTSTG